MTSLATLCGKELRDLSRNRSVRLLILFLAAVVVLSVLVAAADFRAKTADYNSYLQALTPPAAVPSPRRPRNYSRCRCSARAWNTWKSLAASSP